MTWFRKFVYLYLTTISVADSLVGQDSKLIFHPVNNRDLQQFKIRHITTDNNGKLWLSTDNGLLSYDGNEVKAFKHDNNDPSSISSDNISKTFSDSQGSLYVINDFHERNLSLLNSKTGKFTVLNVALTLNDYRMMATPFAYSDLLVDDDGSNWLASYYVGFIHYNIVTAKTDSYYLNEIYSGNNTVYTIKKDVNDKQLLWLGTQNGIYSFNKQTKELTRNFRCANPADSSLADMQVMSMDIYNADSIWFSVPEKGIGCYNIKTGYYTIYPTLKKNQKENNEAGIIQIQKKDKDEYFALAKYSLPGIFNVHTLVLFDDNTF